jgi:ATP-dependent DNA helicase RecG
VPEADSVTEVIVVNPEELLRLVDQGEGQQFEQTPVRQATLDDLGEQKVKEFLVRRLRTGIPDRPLDELLENMGAASLEGDTWRPTVAGLLFFGNWPQFHLSHATILAARLVGPRGIQIIDRATIEGTLPEMIDRAMLFVQRNTRHGLQIGRGQTARAQELDEYPMEAVREAITNACCHRDYLERSPIQLKIYDDRLVVGNPGGLLPGLDVEHLEGKHKARNPRLADWLHALGYVERFGIGIIRMREAMAQAGLPAPLFRSDPDWFEVTLLGPGQVFMATNDEEGSASASSATASPPPRTEARASQPWYMQTWSVANR